MSVLNIELFSVIFYSVAYPEDQHIKTNQQNILIRSLTLKKHKGDSSSKDGSEGSRKRYYHSPLSIYCFSCEQLLTSLTNHWICILSWLSVFECGPFFRILLPHLIPFFPFLRTAEKVLDGRDSAKRPNSQVYSRQGRIMQLLLTI